MYNIESSGSKSGLLNSDSKILKITGYEMNGDESGFICTLRDAGLNELRMNTCHWSQGFDNLEGSENVLVKETGMYKIAMAGDIINKGTGSISIGLQQVNRESFFFLHVINNLGLS
jgi:hypothetical protein